MNNLQTRLSFETFKEGLAVLTSANLQLNFESNSEKVWFAMVNHLEPALFRAAVVRVSNTVSWHKNVGMEICAAACEIAKTQYDDDSTVYEKESPEGIARGKKFAAYFRRCMASGVKMDNQLVEDVRSGKKDISEFEKPVNYTKTKKEAK